MVDLHTHLAAHIPYGFMLNGQASDPLPEKLPTYKHTFDQQMYRNWLIESGIKVFVDAALMNIFVFDKEGAKEQILRQFAWSKNFINRNRDVFVLAKTPAQARLAMEKGKIVFVRALEGAEYLVSTQEDVDFWKSEGVAMIGPIHLADNMYGDASIMTGAKSILNPLGTFRRWFSPEKRQGLTGQGKKSIEYLLSAGIIVDMAHMSPKSTDQSLEIYEKMQLPPVMSHGYLKSIKNDPRGLSKLQLKRIYDLQGLIGITSGSGMLSPSDKELSSGHSEYCKDSIDDYLFHLEQFQKIVGMQAPLGWGSDANGFVSHFKPKYGELGCYPNQKSENLFANNGLRGLFDLKNMFDYMESKNINYDQIKNSGVRFIEIWEKLYNNSQSKKL